MLWVRAFALKWYYYQSISKTEKMTFTIIITLFITQRLIELFIAGRNEKWLLSNGAVEYGKRHYPYIVLLHTCYVISVFCEYNFFSEKDISYPFLLVFICLLTAKIWVISSLGHYWNTKIFRIPGKTPVQTGAYKYFKHPNYILVVGEIAIFPLIFHLYYTAVIFSLLNAVMLSVRIKTENKVWNQS